MRQAIDIALEVVQAILEGADDERANLDKSRLKRLVGNISRKRRVCKEDESGLDHEGEATTGEAIFSEDPRGKVAK